MDKPESRNERSTPCDKDEQVKDRAELAIVFEQNKISFTSTFITCELSEKAKRVVIDALKAPVSAGAPVAWMFSNEEGDDDFGNNYQALKDRHYKGREIVPLFAAPLPECGALLKGETPLTDAVWNNTPNEDLARDLFNHASQLERELAIQDDANDILTRRLEEAAKVIADGVRLGVKHLAEDAGAVSTTGALPIDMLLWCPKCDAQHVDAPQPEQGWTNPPHATHTCQGCGLNWRPSNALTNGVQSLPAQELKHMERMAAADPNVYTVSARQPLTNKGDYAVLDIEYESDRSVSSWDAPQADASQHRSEADTGPHKGTTRQAGFVSWVALALVPLIIWIGFLFFKPLAVWVVNPEKPHVHPSGISEIPVTNLTEEVQNFVSIPFYVLHGLSVDLTGQPQNGLSFTGFQDRPMRRVFYHLAKVIVRTPVKGDRIALEFLGFGLWNDPYVDVPKHPLGERITDVYKNKFDSLGLIVKSNLNAPNLQPGAMGSEKFGSGKFSLGFRPLEITLDVFQLNPKHDELPHRNTTDNGRNYDKPEGEIGKPFRVRGQVSRVFHEIPIVLQFCTSVWVLFFACFLYGFSYCLFEMGRIKSGACLWLLGFLIFVGDGFVVTGLL